MLSDRVGGTAKEVPCELCLAGPQDVSTCEKTTKFGHCSIYSSIQTNIHALCACPLGGPFEGLDLFANLTQATELLGAVM